MHKQDTCDARPFCRVAFASPQQACPCLRACARPRLGVFLYAMRLVVLLTLAATLFITGCSSFNASVKPDTELASYKRVWVKTNMNDNRGLAQFICDALRERGIESDIGPLTMMPLNTQAIISFKDSWTWDFKDHMTGLELEFTDTKIDYPIATAKYVGPTSLTKSPDQVAEKLVEKLFTTKPSSGIAPPPVPGAVPFDAKARSSEQTRAK